MKNIESPYRNEFESMGDRFFLELFITLPSSKTSNKLIINDEDFLKIVELLEEIYPPINDNQTFNFLTEKNEFLIEEVKNHETK